jgi:hypothetical protein
MDQAVSREGAHPPGRALRIALLAASLATLALPASAGAYVYWSSFLNGSIGRANLDGSAADDHFIDGVGQAEGLAVDGAHLYWANPYTDTIGRSDLDGSAVDRSFVTGAADPYEVTVDGAHVYWTNATTHAIGRANLDGSNANQSFIPGVAPCGLAVDGAHIYWTTANATTAAAGAIGRANLDGSGIDQGMIPGVDRPCDIAVDGAYVYWTRSNDDFTGTIGRASLAGSGIDESFVTGTTVLYGITVDASHIYWANGDIPEAIGRANLDGSGVDQRFIDHAEVPTSVAVDSLPDASPTAISCLPASVTLPAAVRCRATVTDTAAAPSAPTGTIAFGTDGAGTFTGAGKCALVATSGSQATCAVTYMASQAGGRTLTASYVGDNAHAGSAASTLLAVAKPSNAFTLAGPKLNRQKGTATVIAKVPGRGKLRVTGDGIEKQRKRVRRSGRVKLAIEPKGAAKRKLGRTGSAKVKPKFTYRPRGGDPKTLRMTLTVKLNQR